jgi:uncharacterized protein
MHEDGEGGPVSMEQARVWYGRAAEQGHATAQYNLAIMHKDGKGVPVSMEQARLWCGRAAEQGHAKAQFSLGIMHKNGEGVPVSMEQARVWWGRAAEQGVAQAQYNLGAIHNNGQGGPGVLGAFIAGACNILAQTCARTQQSFTRVRVYYCTRVPLPGSVLFIIFIN